MNTLCIRLRRLKPWLVIYYRILALTHTTHTPSWRLHAISKVIKPLSKGFKPNPKEIKHNQGRLASSKWRLSKNQAHCYANKFNWGMYLILSLQLVANEVYEHDIMSIQVGLRREIKRFSLIMEF